MNPLNDLKSRVEESKANESLFFGNINFIDNDRTYICESMEEARVIARHMRTNAVLYVPLLSTTNLAYIGNSYERLKSVKEFIICSAFKHEGVLLRNKLAERLGKVKCKYINIPEPIKNLKSWSEGLSKDWQSALENPLRYPIEHEYSRKELDDLMDEFIKNGPPIGDEIEYPLFSQHMKFASGELTTITGIPNSGKSEFIDQTMVSLARKHKWRWGIFSFENPVQAHTIKLIKKIADDPRNKTARDFLFDSFKFLKLEESDTTIDGILNKAKEIHFQYGLRGILIDPYNYIEHKIPKGQTETQYISEVLTKIKRFCFETQIHVFLVAHPSKIGKHEDGTYKVATMYDVAGSAHFYNKTDNGISVYRHFAGAMQGLTTVYIQKVRFNWNGSPAAINFRYDVPTGIYTEHEQQFDEMS